MSETCCICGKSLAGGLDTYGEQGEEICEACWLTMQHEIEIADPGGEGVIYWFGVEDTLLLRRQILRRRDGQRDGQQTLDALLPLRAKGWVY